MKNESVYLVEKGRFEMRESPMPAVGADDLLIEVRHVAYAAPTYRCLPVRKHACIPRCIRLSSA